MKKYFLLLFLFCVVGSPLMAQPDVFPTTKNAKAASPCGFDYKHKKLLTTSPQYAASVQRNEQILQEAIAHSQQAGERSAMTIPVVINVIHLGEAVGTGSNISTAAANQAITDLNTYFNPMGVGFEIGRASCRERVWSDV